MESICCKMIIDLVTVKLPPVCTPYYDRFELDLEIGHQVCSALNHLQGWAEALDNGYGQPLVIYLYG